MDQRVQVLIADYEVHTRRGLQALLAAWPQIEVVGVAANGVEAVQMVEKCQPDVALIDIPIPVLALPALDGRPGSGAEGMDALEAIRLIKSRQPQVRIVVLTMYTAHRAAALAAGADAFLLKGCPAHDLLEAISSHAALSATPHPSRPG
jgi:two-component system response regulator DesR